MRPHVFIALALAAVFLTAAAVAGVAAQQEIPFDEATVYNVIFRPFERGMIYDPHVGFEIPLCLKYGCRYIETEDERLFIFNEMGCDCQEVTYYDLSEVLHGCPAH